MFCSAFVIPYARLHDEPLLELLSPEANLDVFTGRAYTEGVLPDQKRNGLRTFGRLTVWQIIAMICFFCPVCGLALLQSGAGILVQVKPHHIPPWPCRCVAAKASQQTSPSSPVVSIARCSVLDSDHSLGCTTPGNRKKTLWSRNFSCGEVARLCKSGTLTWRNQAGLSTS